MYEQDELTARLSLPVRNHVAAKVPSTDIDDVTQEALLRIWEKRAQFAERNDAGLETWAAHVTASVIATYYEKRERHAVLVSENFKFTPESDTVAADRAPAPRTFGEGEEPEEEDITPVPDAKPVPSTAWMPNGVMAYDADDEVEPIGFEAVAPADDEPEALAIAEETASRVAPVLLRMLDPEEPGIGAEARETRLKRLRTAVRATLDRDPVYTPMRQAREQTPAELYRTLERILFIDRRAPAALIEAAVNDYDGLLKVFGFTRETGAGLDALISKAWRLFIAYRIRNAGVAHARADA